MRVRKAVAFTGLFLIFLACLMMYIAMDVTVFPNHRISIHEEYQENKWLHFEDRLKQLENDLSKHHEEVGEIKEAMKVLVPASSSTTSPNRLKKNVVKEENFVSRIPASEIIFNSSCSFQVQNIPRTDIHVRSI